MQGAINQFPGMILAAGRSPPVSAIKKSNRSLRQDQLRKGRKPPQFPGLNPAPGFGIP
jgi:hypothetical protein